MGVVIEKVFVPHHTETILMYNAALKMPLPQTLSHPDSWYLVLDGVNGNGKRKNQRVYVSKSTYEAYNEGDWYEPS